MRSTATLPEGYEKTDELSARSSRSLFRKLNLLSTLLAFALIAAGWAWKSFAPLSVWMEQSFGQYYTIVLLALAGILCDIVLHELTHALLMYLFSGQRPFFARSGLLLSAGCSAYLTRSRCLLITLGPSVLWGAALLTACALVPDQWFWPLYYIAVLNFSLSIDDIYCAILICKQPRQAFYCHLGILVQVYRTKP